MLMPRDDGFDEHVIKDAQHEAAQWGADRFAEEFRRRDEEERRLRDAEAGIFFRYPGVSYPGDEPEPEMLSGPVDESVRDRAIETTAVATVEIRKPKPVRHGHVARPPAQDRGPSRRRSRTGRREERSPGTSWAPSEAELASMSSAGRRLYGIVDEGDRRPTR